MYFVILLVPPLYFLLRKKWGGFIVNAVLYGIAVVCVMSIFFAWLAILPWALAVGHAGWHLRREVSREFLEEHATLIAAKMAQQSKLASGLDGTAISKTGSAIPSVASETRPRVMLATSTASTFCENCGAKIDSRSSFCEECGVSLAS